ncbi:MAG: DUF790 family protein [Nitrososphaeraceae archaeon]
MLPAELLQYKIINKGKNIVPLFCDIGDVQKLDIANTMIDIFKDLSTKKSKKGILQEQISILESDFNNYKLIRSFAVLLERRCNFQYPENYISISNTVISSYRLRQMLFEESSKIGLSLDNNKRKQIFNKISSQIDIPVDYIEKYTWSDLEENLLLTNFNCLSPVELIDRYNLSILQTLLFGCTKFDFSMNGGKYWKQVLRYIKKFGLMYELKSTISHTKSIIIDNYERNHNLLCTIDGPLSIFKLSTKYGTMMSKLLPYIVMAPNWLIKGWIVRNTSKGQKLYELNLSNNDISFSKHIFSKDIFNNVYEFISPLHNNKNYYLYDSTVEKKFADKFIQAKTKWNLIREPDPLILTNGHVIIPDFLFTRSNKKVYFEIVGFWTLDYLKRKFQKVKDILESNKEHFLIAVDKRSLVSNKENLKPFNYLFQDRFKEHFIFYENNMISLKNILKYLKFLDNEIIHYEINNNKSLICRILGNLIKTDQDIISLDKIALQQNVTIESILQIIKSYLTKDQINNNYTIIGSYLILNKKLKQIFSLLEKEENFNNVRSILIANNIPESLHISVITNLGFEIEWQGLDNSNIVIRKKK